MTQDEVDQIEQIDAAGGAYYVNLDKCFIETGDRAGCNARMNAEYGLDHCAMGPFCDPTVMSALLIGGSAALCVFAGPETGLRACLPLVGVATYTGGVALDHLARGELNPFDPLQGWNWQDAAVSGGATTAAGLTPGGPGTLFAASVVLGIGSDLASQWSAGQPLDLQHAACTGFFGGGYSSGYDTGSSTYAKGASSGGGDFAKGLVWGVMTNLVANNLCPRS